MPLTDAAVRTAKPDPKKTLRLKDDRGLYLEISISGGKWWRLRYWIAGKENRLSLGIYPDVSLKEARLKRDEARLLISRGIDPAAARKGEQRKAVEDALTFEAVAREWLAKRRAGWAASTAEVIQRRLERNVFPFLGARPIRQITSREMLALARKHEARGVVDSARRAIQTSGQVFRYALAAGMIDADPTPALRGALETPLTRHHATITEPRDVGALLRAAWGYNGTLMTICALKLAAMTFVRPGELRQAEWSEFNMETVEWRIPAARMKMGEPHIVPLSTQVLAVLEELRPVTGQGRYLFPSIRSERRPMSEATINAALRALGYSKEQMTGHGFRSMASTLLNEQGWNRDYIERQLAHAERNKVRGAYNYAEYLPERRRMLQAWADYLDSLREGGIVVPMFRAGGE